MIRVFISYRRRDTAQAAGRLAEDIRERFGRRSVFMDTFEEAIRGGDNFRDEINNWIAGADVVLVMIGKDWTGTSDENRLQDPEDLVRQEVETAFKKKRRILPVLVSGAKIPDAEALPESLRFLSEINARPLQDDPYFNEDARRIKRDIFQWSLDSRARPSEEAKFQGLVEKSFDRFHLWWINHPWKMALFGLLYALLLAIASFPLGIDQSIEWIERVGEKPPPGYLQDHWGWQTFIFLPLACIVFAWLARKLESGVYSLDRILGTEESSGDVGSELFAEWFRKLLAKQWLFPIVGGSIAAVTALTFWFDWRGILGPVLYDSLAQVIDEVPKDKLGWGTAGAFGPDRLAPGYYLVFNLAVFSTQIFYGYCGLVIIILFTILLWSAMSKGLSGGHRSDGTRWKVYWDFSDPSGRCGLFELDRVYVSYVVCTIVALGVCTVSVVKHFWNGQFDGGSQFLVGVGIVFFPVAFFWLIFPYWSLFPRRVPEGEEDFGYEAPSPWPLRSKWVTWAILGGAAILWVVLGLAGLIGTLGSSRQDQRQEIGLETTPPPPPPVPSLDAFSSIPALPTPQSPPTADPFCGFWGRFRGAASGRWWRD